MIPSALKPSVQVAEALLKAYTVRRKVEQPEAEREKYWLLTDQRIDQLVASDHSSPRPVSQAEEYWLREYQKRNYGISANPLAARNSRSPAWNGKP